MPYNPPLPTRYRNPRTTPARLRLSAASWEGLTIERDRYGYKGRSPTTGMSHYLLALMRANPTTPDAALIANWYDNRAALNPDLPLDDAFRLNTGRFRAWCLHPYAPGPYRTTAEALAARFRTRRDLNKHVYNRILPDLLRLSIHFGIAPFRGTPSPLARANAVLEAIGLDYLASHNPPPPCPKPMTQQRTKFYKDQYATQSGKSNIDSRFVW